MEDPILSSEDKPQYFVCQHVGVAGTTPVTIKQDVTGFEARVGIALFGATNLDEDGFRAAQYNPFHENFHDNYASGKGATQEEAIAAMEVDLDEIQKSIFL